VSGYENSPDYGGRPVTRWELVAIAVAVLIASLALLYWGVRQPQRLAPSAAVDVSFTITGLAQCPDGALWAGDHGQRREGQTDYASGLVRIDTGERIASGEQGSVQGVACDESGALWYVLKEPRAAAFLVRYGGDAMPLEVDSNGLAIDTRRDAFIVAVDHVGLVWLDRVSMTERMRLPMKAVDQVHYDATADRVLVTYGPNRKPGRLAIVAMGERPHVVRTLALKGADAIEGVILRGGEMLIANDADFHRGDPPRNRILTFPAP